MILAVTVLLGQVEVQSGGQSHVLSFRTALSATFRISD